MKPVDLPNDEWLHPQHTHEWWYFFAALTNVNTGAPLHYTTALMRRDVGWLSYRRWHGPDGPELDRAVHMVPSPAPGATEVTVRPRSGDWTVRIGAYGRSRHELGKIGWVDFFDADERGPCLHTPVAQGGIRRYGGSNEMAWYSWPWLRVAGRLGNGDEVEGLGWMEHQWGNTDFQRLSWRYLPLLERTGARRWIAFRYEHVDHAGSAAMEVAELVGGESRIIAGATFDPTGPTGILDTSIHLGPTSTLQCHSDPNGTVDLRPLARHSFFEGATEGRGAVDGAPVAVVGMTELHPR